MAPVPLGRRTNGRKGAWELTLGSQGHTLRTTAMHSCVPLDTTAGIALPMLGQDSLGSVSFAAQFEYFLNAALTPSGIALLTGAALAVSLALYLGKGLEVLSIAALFCLTTMLHEQSLTKNVLIGPLQSLRNVARPVAFALVAAALLPALFMPSGWRQRPAGPVAAWFLAFQLYYTLLMAIFVNPAKGAIGLLAIVGMYLVFARGFGKMMQDVAGVHRTLSLFFVVSLGFVMANCAQLAINPSNAVVAGRLAGIAGNAQQMGTVCLFLLLTNLYLLNSKFTGKLTRLFAAGMAGLLALFIIWTGSRANALAGLAGFAWMFRLQLGRLALTALAVGAVFAIGTLLFEGSTSGAGRFVSDANTRAEVWANSLDAFSDSPIVGAFPFGIDAASESSYISALANTGLVGFALLMIPVAGMILSATQAMHIRRHRPDLSGICDYLIGMTAAIIVVNAFEGFATGVLTFPLMFMYTTFAIGAFLQEASQEGEAVRQDDGAIERVEATGA